MKKSGKSSVRGIVALITVCALLLGMGAFAAAVSSPTAVKRSAPVLAQAETGRAKDLYIPQEEIGGTDTRSIGIASFANRPTVVGAEENGGRWSAVTFGRFGGTRLWLFNNAALVSGSDALPVLQQTVSSGDVSAKVSASDAEKETSATDGELVSVEYSMSLLAEGDTDISFAVEQSYADDVEDKPTSFGKVTLETYGSRITPAGGSSAVQQYNTTAAADGGTIASGAQMSNLKILSYDRKYPIKSVQVFVNGEDATSEVGTFFSKTTDDHGRAKWTYNFNSGFKFADGSDVTFKVVYGGWEKYTLSQRYDDSIPADERPSAYGSIYVLTSSGTMSDGVTNTNNVTLTSSEQSETGHIEPNLKINYIRVTPPNYSRYYIKSVRILVDGVDVTDTAISSASRPEEGEWKLTFRTDYVISAGSTLKVEAVYNNWKTYTLRQGYDGSIVPEPETFGKVTFATTQAAIVTEGSTTVAYSDSIEKTQASGWGYIKPNAELNYVRVEPDGNCSVRSVRIYIDGVDVTDEAIDLNRAATVKPSTGTWVLYFKSGYKLPAGSSLVVDVKYGGWESYEIRQGYDSSVDPAPETFGEVIVAASQPAFIYEGISGFAYDAKIDKTQASGTGIIKPDTRMNYVKATPMGNYSVRSLKVFVDGVDVTEEAINWNAAATVTPSTGEWILYFNSNFVIADGSVLEVEATYGGW
ncbi:MAG: hypothetical protein IJP10_02785, partial [Clostridia bacterium]|nr:hypothetical protein [Clostridia bacterium]